MAFPLAAIGAGLGQGVQALQQQQQNQLRLAMLRQQLQQQQYEQQAAQAAWGALSGGDLSGLAGLGGGPPHIAPTTASAAPADAYIPPSSSGEVPQGYERVGRGIRAIPQPQSKLVPGGALSKLDPDLIPVAKRESSFKPFVGYGGSDLSNAPLDDTGFPQWPGKMGPKGISHAAGLLQIQPGTWRPVAKDLGIHDFSPESQVAVGNELKRREGLKPWAASAPPQLAQAAQQTAQKTAQITDPFVYGRMSLSALAKQIDKANPSAPPIVKMMALQQVSKMLAPSENQMWQMFMLNNRQSFQQELATQREQTQRDLASQRQDFQRELSESRGSQFEAFRDPQGNLHYLRKGEPIPEGWQRDNRRFVGAQGMALQTFIDEFTRENGKPPGSQDIRNWQAANTMQTSEARSVGSRAGLLETAANSAEALMPLLVEKSGQINRTEYPTINKIILAFNEQTGDPNVVQYGEMINSMRYLYARAMSPTGQARVADLNNFDAIMNKAWTTGQIQAGIEQIKKSLDAERKGLTRTREGIVQRGTPGGSPSSAAAPQAQWQPPQGLPDPKGKPDGTKARDDATGEVVAVIKNGQWTAP